MPCRLLCPESIQTDFFFFLKPLGPTTRPVSRESKGTLKQAAPCNGPARASKCSRARARKETGHVDEAPPPLIRAANVLGTWGVAQKKGRAERKERAALEEEEKGRLHC